jgi:signal transduction histidine kinase
VSAPSLYALLRARRADLIHRWNDWVKREVTAAEMPSGELIDSMPVFIEELIETLAPKPASVAAPPPGQSSARVHGGERLRLGFDVAAVVREYNLLRRAILELAEVDGLALTLAEYTVLSDVVSQAQVVAVAEYQRKRDQEQKRQAAEHLAFLAHELRNPLSNALTAFALLRSHVPAANARHVALLDRGLRRVTALLDETLVAGRLNAGGVLARTEMVDLTACAREIAEEHGPQAEHRSLTLNVQVEDGLAIEADARLLRSLLANLMGNAIKFSRAGSVIVLRAHRAAGIVIAEIEDGCGGLPAEQVTAIFDPHVQMGADRSGFGLGLAIAKQAAEAHGGTLQVQNLEGRGCCFRLELPAPA